MLMFSNACSRYRASGTAQSGNSADNSPASRGTSTPGRGDEKGSLKVVAKTRGDSVDHLFSPRLSVLFDGPRDMIQRPSVWTWRFVIFTLAVCATLSVSSLINPSLFKLTLAQHAYFNKLAQPATPPVIVNTIKGEPTVSHEVAPTRSDSEETVRPGTLRRHAFHKQLPECARDGKRARSFLLVFMGHSGSTAIMSELRSHPEIAIEIMELVDHGENAKNVTRALEQAGKFFDRKIDDGKVPGFKIRPRHIRLHPELWASFARRYDSRIVWQYRRNTLKHAVGEYAYRHLGDNKTKEGLKSEEEVEKRCSSDVGCAFKIANMSAFHFILNGLVGVDHIIAEAADLIADGRDCLHELRYEDYLYHRKGAMQDLRQFLGVKQIDTEPERYKATKDNLCDVVTNWEELCRNFYGCAVWRHLFEDERNKCTCRFSESPVDFCKVALPERKQSPATFVTPR